MKKKLFFVLPCVLIALFYSACNKCKDTFSAYIQSNYVPYSQGSTFAMTDNSGRVIHFTVATYSDQYMEDYRDSQEQKCVNGTELVKADFTSDSTGISFSLQEQGRGSNGVAIDDAIALIWMEDGKQKSFDAAVSNTTFVGLVGSTTTSQGSQTIGNRSYSDVFEWGSDAQLPDILPNKAWYNKTEGLLKIAFTDSTFWTIVN